MGDVISIQDIASVPPEEPTEILFLIIFTIIGVSLICLFLYNSRFRMWVKPKLGKPKLAKTPYDGFDENKLKEIISKLSNNYRILITVYGILLAFIISDKINFAYTNWNFIIWTGWILAVIVRAGMHLTDLTDIIEKGRSIERVRFDIYSYREFLKHSIVLLVVGIAFLPSFMFLTPVSEDTLNNLPWSRSASILSGAVGILSSTFMFYFVLNLAPSDVKFSIFTMYLYATLLFLMGSVSAWSNLSPIEPKLVSLGYQMQFHIPQLLVTILSISAGTPGFIIILVVDILYNKKKKKQ